LRQEVCQHNFFALEHEYFRLETTVLQQQMQREKSHPKKRQYT